MIVCSISRYHSSLACDSALRRSSFDRNADCDTCSARVQRHQPHHEASCDRIRAACVLPQYKCTESKKSSVLLCWCDSYDLLAFTFNDHFTRASTRDTRLAPAPA